MSDEAGPLMMKREFKSFKISPETQKIKKIQFHIHISKICAGKWSLMFLSNVGKRHLIQNIFILCILCIYQNTPWYEIYLDLKIENKYDLNNRIFLYQLRSEVQNWEYRSMNLFTSLCEKLFQMFATISCIRC